MAKSQKDNGGIFSGLVGGRKFFVGRHALRDVQTDPHLARDIGVPYRPRTPTPLKVLW